MTVERWLHAWRMDRRRRPPTRSGTAVAVLVAVVSTTLTVASIEAAFRLTGVEAGETRWLGNDVYPANPDGYFSPCGDGRYCVAGDRASVHGCGAPPDGRRQVLFVGDSFTYGTGVRPADAYSTLLEFPGYQRRNCAEPGANVTMVRDQLARFASDRPALTVYGMVLNDFDRLRNDLVVDPPGAGWTWEQAQVLDDYVNTHMVFES